MITKQNLSRPIKNKQATLCNQLMNHILFKYSEEGAFSRDIRGYGVDGARYIIASVRINILFLT